MGHVAGDQEVGGIVIYSQTTEKAHVSAYLLGAKCLTCRGAAKFFEGAIALPDLCSAWGE